MGCGEESSILQSWNISTTLYHGSNIFLWNKILGINSIKVWVFYGVDRGLFVGYFFLHRSGEEES